MLVCEGPSSRSFVAFLALGHSFVVVLYEMLALSLLWRGQGAMGVWINGVVC